MKKMRNVGQEIKGLSDFIRALICILFILCGLVLISQGLEAGEEIPVVIGVLVIILGLIVAWFVTLLLYGYGELIEQTMQTNYAVRDLQNTVYNNVEEISQLMEKEVQLLSEIAEKS